jgi:hypothetical protein
VSEIRYVRHDAAEPSFPATDQHPDAKRYRFEVGGKVYWVDAIGEPTEKDLTAHLAAIILPIEDDVAALECRVAKIEVDLASLQTHAAGAP